MPKLCLEVFPSGQRRLWDQFQRKSTFLAHRGYYLAGGSALALQTGHRQTVDFDFFSEKKALAASTQEWLKPLPGFLVRDRDKDTLHAEVKGVTVSFISGYKYPLVARRVKAGGVQLAGLLDIALMKLLAIAHRATLRDYLDLAAILRDHLDLKKLIDASGKKYGKNLT